MAPNQQPHAVMFPYPAQGHINPMMQLAQKLLSSGFFITFVNTDFNHQRMFHNGSSQRLLQLPHLRFEHLPDGLPPSHGRFNQNVPEVTAAILALPGPFTKLVQKIMAGSGPPVTCIIADSFCSWMQDVADQLGIPRVSLWTTPVHANLAYYFQSTLMAEGYIPLKDGKDTSKIVTCVPGVAPMPLSEYISFFQVEDTSDFLFQWHLNLCMRRPKEATWNLGNNFLELEGEAAEAFQKEVGNFLPVGPLLPESRLRGEGWSGGAVLSVWEEDGECKGWLDEQEERSVLYISFGSIANMGGEEVEEIVRGLEESGAPFLWAVRPGQGAEALERLRRSLAKEAAEQKRRRGLVVAWAPQLAVLFHKSVGGFLSHCGWNSVTESVCAGVPILALPGGFAEQRMNAYYISHVWKIGVPLAPPPTTAAAAAPPPLTRGVVSAQICALLNAATCGGIRARVDALRSSALSSISAPSGTSHINFNLFVQDMQRLARDSSSLQPPLFPNLPVRTHASPVH